MATLADKKSRKGLLLALGLVIAFAFCSIASAEVLSVNAGCDNNYNFGGGRAYNSNGTTPLAVGYVVQYIYAGTNNTIDPANSITGGVSGDDVLITNEAIGNDTVWWKFTNQPGMFYHQANGSYTSGTPLVYVRVWNSTAILTATSYGNSILFSPKTQFFLPNDVGLPNIIVNQPFTPPTVSVVIDDYEVGTSALSYTAGGAYPPLNGFNSVNIYEGARSRRITYDGNGTGSAESFIIAVLPNNKNITSADAVSLWIRGDGTANTIRLDLIETAATPETYSSPNIPMPPNDGVFHEVKIPMIMFTLNLNGNIVDSVFSKNINQYSLVYKGTNTPTTDHYIDYIAAISGNFQPTVTNVIPNTGSNTTTTNVTVEGTNFTGATAVNIGITPASSFVVISATTIEAVVPAGLTPGVYDVTVTTPIGTSAINPPYDQFTVTAVTALVIDNYEGNCGIAGYYTAGTIASYETTTLDKYEGLKSERIRYSYPGTGWGGLVGATFTADKDITFANGVSLWVKGDGTTNEARLDLVESSTAPISAETWSSTQIPLNDTTWHQVQIPFTGFTRNPFGNMGDNIFNRVIAQYQVVYTTQNATTESHYIDYIVAAQTLSVPTVTNVIPNTGANIATTNVTIEGTNFTGATAVNIGITPASSFVVISATTIEAVVPIGMAPGTYEVRVTTPLGTSALNPPYDQFTVTGPITALVIDNYEGNSGIAGYYTAGDIASYETTTLDKYEGLKSERIRYSYPGTGWGGLVGGLFTADKDITFANRVSLWVKGDGTTNEARLDFVESSTAPISAETWSSTQIPLNDTTWHQVQIPFTGFTRNPLGNMGDNIFNQVIAQYQLVYTTQNATTESHYIDYIVAVTGGPTVTISNVSITRDADAVGSSVTLTWTVAPVGSAVDIWTISGSASVEVFTTNPASWTKEQANYLTTTWTNLNQVGQGTQKYYKLMPAGAVLTNIDLNTDVVGKYDLFVDIDPTKFFISIPLIPNATSVASVIGNQVTPGDILLTFNMNKDVTEGAIYLGVNNWTDFYFGTPSTMEVKPLYGYGFVANAPKNITVAGAVASQAVGPRTILGGGGGPTISNWIGTAFPANISVEASGLNASAMSPGTPDPGAGGTLFFFDSAANVLEMHTHSSNIQWINDLTMLPSTYKLKVGVGYMFTDPVANFSWTQPKP